MRTGTQWDIFCRVIDNYGDIGVCWRLSADLAARGDRVRLWVDDPCALTWMAPGARQGRCDRIDVLDWQAAGSPSLLQTLPPADAWIEAFGCDIPTAFLEHQLRRAAAAPVWINLEYLSAEAFARRAHGLPSPVQHGVAKGCTKHFFYPGFTPESGGLIREPDLAQRRTAFDRAGWLAGIGIGWRGEQLVSLFCYEPAALADLLAQWQAGSRPTRLLVTHGRAAAAVRALRSAQPAADPASALSIDFLEPLTQRDFDHLLWAADMNLVRGEDSLVRALWAGKPLLWQIYPQQDDAHRAKLLAFLDQLDAPDALRTAHAVWNGMRSGPLAPPDLQPWARWAADTRDRLESQPDLATRLSHFVAAHRAPGGPGGGTG